MTDSGKAVFLSYASQDAEAALRLCSGLRAAGVEVWFDQNELVGGDAWDAKIRGQIAACALFVPMISANTNARGEGYFRLEWKLAVDRSHLMAHDQPFLLPLVIDETSDSAARVPPEFRALQWTRLQDGDTSEAFCARVKALLEGGVGARPSPAAFASERPRAVAVPGKTRRWIAPAMAALAVAGALVFWQPWKKTPPVSPPSSSPAAVAPKAPVPVSEARQLLAKAWVQLKKPEMGRAELEAAELLCKRASELDAADAEVWATWTHVHHWMITHKLDFSPARREAAQSCATRAIQLDSASYEARLAQAIQMEGFSTQIGREREKRLRELVQERPDDWRAVHALAQNLLRLPATRPEGIALLERAAQNPENAALAWMDLGWFHHNRTKDCRKALDAAEKSIAARPFWHNLGLKAQLAAFWLGDLDLALATAKQLKPADRQEDWAVALFYRIYAMRREPKELLKFLESIRREWISSNAFTGPKAALTGWARMAEGAPELALRDYRHALDLVERRLLAEPNEGRLLGFKAILQFESGDEVGARKTYEIYQKLGLRTAADPFWVLEPPDVVMTRLEADLPLAAELRLDPFHDRLREHPRFAALQAKVDADPSRSPHAPQPAAASESTPTKK